MTSSATDSTEPARVARGLAGGVVAGVVAVGLAAVVGVVVWAALSFAVRQGLTESTVADEWLGRARVLLALGAAGVGVRFGIRGVNPAVPGSRVVAAVALGLGAALLLWPSAWWPAAAVGVGWGVGAGRNVVRVVASAGVGLVVALVGLGLETTSLTSAVMTGIGSAAIVAAVDTALVAAATMARNRGRPPGSAA